MHHDDAGVVGARLAEFLAGPVDLLARELADDADVAHVPGERVPRDAVRRVEPHERDARHA